MKKYILLIVIVCSSAISFAHSPDASTIVLAEQKNSTWVLQINASLTAFQQEVRTHFADTPYKTPEEFQEMVLAHIKNNLLISFNNGEQITLGKGIVKLGHETKVIFEIKDIPASIESAVISNKVFTDISRNQSVLMVFKEGFVKDHFNLNQANDHTIALLVKDNKFVETAQQNANISPSLIIIFLLAFMGLGYLIKKMLELKTKSTFQDD
ncbi:hypothetical protein [Maribacter sp.]|uniref:hypothetical protein n=1 Tax=Maribacter sp. TaxID=1897614 RepID=UPI00329911C4